ncbi:hypothetical protein AKJ09_05790 [Labilithrix luteola]|uniref:Cellulose-binding domain protein n=1 Tax=Labilithrix luteola TaxID=1391654 RepID=A0A0K1Q0F3_9BACT|nr:hypothetical protein [Labilithrix luteola]AKU99126.1 hypothetical protein AKJ09_05790 [Labilithrix luteola]
MTSLRSWSASLLLTAASLGAIANCSSNDADGAKNDEAATPNDGKPPPLPFEPVAPASYVAKVKNLLTGLPATESELRAVQADPNALKGLIDTWMAMPESDAKLIQFFGNAFQQTAMTAEDFTDQIGDMTAVPDALMPNLRESFARTALKITREGRPFRETVTTHEFMMTTAMLTFYAFLDVRLRDDKQNDKDKLSPPRTADFVWTAVDDSKRHIDPADSVNPQSPNYLTWSVGPSSVLGPVGSQCVPRTFHSAMYSNASVHLFKLQFGTLGKAPVTADGCPNSYGIDHLDPFLKPADFNDWHPVTIVRASAAEPSNLHLFYDLPKLRTLNRIVLDVPRVGFFSTPSFFANWQTNVNNLARVTTNQSLIVALGRSINPEDIRLPVSETGLDTQHADPTTTCYACHRYLDPMREWFRNDLSLTYHEQLKPFDTVTPASFSFGGVDVGAVTNTIDEFAGILASHPLLPAAWAQKLCVWADSAACTEYDPEFLRVVDVFKAGNLDFRVLVRELLSSPLVTAATRTKTFEDRNPVVSIMRRDHFCTALAVRLGIDACNLPGAKDAKTSRDAYLLSSNVPADSYARGAQIPNLISAPGLFHRSTAENLCELVAGEIIDRPGSKYQSAQKDDAIADFVSNLMGLSAADDRAAPIGQILQEHYTAAIAAGGKPNEALRSTFTLACTSPLVTGLGL